MLALLLLLAVTTADIVVVSVPMRGNVEVPLTPAGKAELRREGTLTRVQIEVQRVPPMAAQGAGANTYVAWAISPEGVFENLGELDERGRLQTATRFDQIGIIVTAEPHYLVDRPNSTVVFRGGNPEPRIRRITVPVLLGTHDYSAIPFPPKDAQPNIVAQSRYAFQIAKAVETRLAEAELRQAQISIDTMEEMIRRQTPIEIVWPAAHEAIRKSQQTVVAARERATLSALETARAEGVTLRDNNQQLQTRVQNLTEQLAAQQAASAEQARKLETDIAALRQEIVRLGQERDRELNQERERAATRERELEALLTELRQRVNSLQQDLTVRLRDEFIDPAGTQLTDAGLAAFTRVLNLAAIAAGPIRIEGPASDALFNAARQFFMDSGIPQDRIMTVR